LVKCTHGHTVGAVVIDHSRTKLLASIIHTWETPPTECHHHQRTWKVNDLVPLHFTRAVASATQPQAYRTGLRPLPRRISSGSLSQALCIYSIRGSLGFHGVST
jgi:hypothetical protein